MAAIENDRSSRGAEHFNRNRVLDVVVPVFKIAAVLFMAEKVMFTAKSRVGPPIRSSHDKSKGTDTSTAPFQHEPGRCGRHAIVNDDARKQTNLDGIPRGRWWRRNKKRGNH